MKQYVANLRQNGLLLRPTDDWSICVLGRLFRLELCKFCLQYLCQLRKAEGGLRGMNTPQASDLVENLAS
jgi:hypothetical protein